MVKFINNPQSDETIINQPPLVVELVGPAASGKTTLSRELGRSNQSIRISDHPCARKDRLFFARQGFLMIPALFSLLKNNQNGRYPTLEEIAWLAILDGWHHVLQREVQRDANVVVIDQGAIYLLAELLTFGPQHLRSQRGKWWDGIYKQWASTLDMVVYLDTSNIDLLERIRGRDDWHIMKDKSKPEVFEFLTRYRVAYEQVISRLVANDNKLRVVYFDTGMDSTAGISNKLFTILKNNP